MTTNEIFDLIKRSYGQKVLQINMNDAPQSIEITLPENQELFLFLRDNDRLYFDMLSSITGIDNGPEDNTMEAVSYTHLTLPTNREV